jgi:hypothetical protein
MGADMVLADTVAGLGSDSLLAYGIAGGIAFIVTVYLLAAMLFPERF